MTEPAQTSRTTKLTCRLQGIRISHSDICHCSTRIILIQRQLKRSQHRKCSSPSLNCPKAGHKISLCEGVSPPLCNVIRDRPYSANPYLPLILPVYLLSLNLQTLGTQNFFFFFGRFCSIQKFPGQGSNLHYSSDPSHSSDNTRSLTH